MHGAVIKQVALVNDSDSTCIDSPENASSQRIDFFFQKEISCAYVATWVDDVTHMGEGFYWDPFEILKLIRIIHTWVNSETKDKRCLKMSSPATHRYNNVNKTCAEQINDRMGIDY